MIMTAQILVGQAHSKHKGVLPRFQLDLWESRSPTGFRFVGPMCWELAPHPGYKPHQNDPIESCWFTVPGKALDDALLMIAILIQRETGITKLASKTFNKERLDSLRPHEKVQNYNLEPLYIASRLIDWRYKIVVTVLRGSVLLRQLKWLKKCTVMKEVCVSSE